MTDVADRCKAAATQPPVGDASRHVGRPDPPPVNDLPTTVPGLRHSTDRSPGSPAGAAGRGFSYRDPDGRPIRDEETLDRIRKLAIPPAWTDVWICPAPNGHLQATGRDARGRKQYRYHSRLPRPARRRQVRAADRRSPGPCRRSASAVDADLARPGLPREKVLAAVVRLLELTLIRVGNDEYARLNRSFGLTTLRDRHATRPRARRSASGSAASPGQQHEVGLRDRRLAAVVRRCRDLPGQELFQYVDEDGDVVDVRRTTSTTTSATIAPDVTAKDFRTWAGTVLAYRALRALDAADDRRARPTQRRRARSARRPTGSATRRPSAAQAYVHPVVVEAYLDGRLGGALVEAAEDSEDPRRPATTPAEERAVISLLRRAARATTPRASETAG